MTRAELFSSICDLAGPTCVSVNPANGWPGIANYALTAGVTTIALHVSVVGSHSRKSYEMRFQNPATSTPVASPGGALPILVGLATVGLKPILVVVDGRSRLGRVARFSILFRDELLISAAADGWAEYVSGTGEHIYAMHPKLLGIYIEALLADAFPEADEVAYASMASGVSVDGTDEAAERARSVGSRLVRDASFSKKVRTAYGERCAMCGLSLGLVVGAHIFPASAPGAPDTVPNGMALCQNHHAAFDKHFIWVDPASHAVKLRPDILGLATSDKAAEIFTSNTRTSVVVPAAAHHKPAAAMFKKRYDHYKGLYDWT